MLPLQKAILQIACLAWISLFPAGAWGLSQTDTPSADCRVDALHPEVLHPLTQAPTHITLMWSRYVQTVHAVRGWKCSEVPLVGFDGAHYFSADYGDDPGFYVFVPRIVAWTGLSTEKAIDGFLIGILLLAWMIGGVGLGRVKIRRPWNWILIAAWIVFGLWVARVGDVYSIQACLPLAVVPWLLPSALQRRLPAYAMAIAAMLGFLAPWSNLLRSQSGNAMLLFFVVVVIGLRERWQRKAAVALMLAAGFIVATLMISSMFRHRDEFLRAHATTEDLRRAHPIWHSVYLGFSYLPNPYVPAYKDTVALLRAQADDPNVRYFSPEYEAILKHATLKLAAEHPLLVVADLLAKSCVALGYALAMFAFGAYSLFQKRPPRSVLAPFLLAMAFTALPGILVVPFRSYLLGLFTFAFLFGCCAIIYAESADDQPAGVSA